MKGESISPNNEWQDVMLAGKIGDRKAAVCRVSRAHGRRPGGCGTGFLINFENHACICTPHHVIAAIDEAHACTVEFDVEEHPMHAGVAKIPFEVPLNPEGLFVTHDGDDMDFTFICVDAKIQPDKSIVIGQGLRTRKLQPMEISPVNHRRGLIGKEVNISAQPKGGLKETKMHRVVDASGNLIYYDEAESGCTGAPVFLGWEVLAIHNQRHADDDTNQAILIKPIVDWVQNWFDQRRQMQVLIDIYYACNGTGWSRKENWLNMKIDLHSWEGVSTDDDGEITIVELKNNNLQGMLPECISQCKRMWKLCMSCNELYGTYETAGIPHSIGDCDSLRVLKLYDNKLEGPIPSTIAKLQHLEVLWLNRNNLAGRIPECLGELANLKTLYLSYNSFTGSIPESLGELRKLQLLDLGYNSLSGPIPESLGQLESMKELYLFYNNLSGTIPESFVNLKNLNSIGVSNNELEGIEEARQMLLAEFGKKN